MAEAQKNQVFTKMNKLIISVILVLLASFTLVSANTAITYNLKDSSNNPLENVDYLIFNCNDNQCSQVSIPNFVNGNNKGNSDSYGSKSDIKIVYPTSLETQYGYAQYFFKDGYLPMEGFANWNGNYVGSKDVIFTKKDSCKAEIKNINVVKTMDNVINSPINIQVDLGSNLASPFRENLETPAYVPINEGYIDFYSGDVKVKAIIYDKNSNEVVYSESKDVSVYMDSNAIVVFSWIPSEEGNYKVGVESNVIDNKCNANTKIIDAKSTDFNILLNELPIVEILAPENDEIIYDDYELIWLATDEDQDDNTLDIEVQYRKDGFSSKVSDVLSVLSSEFSNWKTIQDPDGNQDNNDGSLLWNTKDLENGPYQLRITAIDDDNNKAVSDIVEFWIENIEVGNTDPYFITERLPIAHVNKLYNPKIEALDDDGDEISFYLLQGLDGMTIDESTGQLNWIPTKDYLGDNEITVRIDDGNGGIVDNAYNILVRDGQVEPGEVENVHKFSISNAFAKQNNKFIDVYIQLINRGNKKEDVELQGLIVGVGSKTIAKTTLNLGESDWKILRLRNPGPGKSLIMITAKSNDFDYLKYIEVNIK